jgi:seryl-tRNA synthetase
METLKMEFNQTNKAIGDRKKESKGQDKCEDLMEKSKEIKAQIEEKTKEAEDLVKQRDAKLNLIGNILGDGVPIFKDEDHNEVKVTWGQKSDIVVDGKSLGKLHHHQIMHLLDMVELERG